MARVVIVGAGPAGAGLALALSRRAGVSVDLVEADPGGLGRFRGEGLMPSGLEALERLGVWPLPASVPQRALSGWSFALDGQPLFEAPEPFADGSCCRLIDQPALLGHLLTQAQAAGCRLHSGQPVVALEQAQGRVCGVELADGRRLAADLVVACDGRASSLRRLADLELVVDGDHPLTVLWFQLTGAGAEAIAATLDGRFLTCVGSGDSWALFASVRGGLQLGWAESPGDAGGRRPSDGRAWLERWAAVAPPPLAAQLRTLEAETVTGPSTQPLQVGLAPHWQRPGLLLLGDAAHPMSPLRAQGLSMALRDAVVADAALGPLLAEREPASESAGEPQPGGGTDGRTQLERTELERRELERRHRERTARAWADLDAAAAAVAATRSREIVAIQRHQHQEAERAALLRRQGWLRALLRSLAPLTSEAIRRRWVREQDRLRHGLPLA